MAHAASGIGLQNPAFFVGRAELLDWVNGLLNLKLTKVEQVASGAVHCQILDACHPGVVNMSKVNFSATSEYDMVNNYKQLQVVFDKLKIARNVEVSKLVKARPLDNLEFLQWMKHYYETVTGGVRPEGYDGDERRNASKGGGAAMRKATNSGSVNARTVVGTKTAAASGKTAKPTVGVAVGTSSRGAPATASAPGGASSSQEMKRLVAENAELKLAVERAEQEREFYFEKLQDIEFLCQRDDFLRTHLGKVVEKILYFTEGKPDVDAIIKECADTGVGVETGEALPETADALPAVESLETAALESLETAAVVEDEDEVTTPNFAEAAALGEAMASEADSLLNEQHEDEAAGDVSMTAASPLCAPATAETLRTPLSPQKVNV